MVHPVYLLLMVVKMMTLNWCSFIKGGNVW